MWDTSDDDNISCMCISHIEDIAKVLIIILRTVMDFLYNTSIHLSLFPKIK